MVLTCHGVFSGSVFSFSSVVGGIVASGLIVRFPFLEADHFPRWSWGTCYVKKWERFYSVSHSMAHTAFHVTVHLTNTHGLNYVSTVYGSFIFHFYFSWLLFLPSSLHPWQLLLHYKRDSLTWRWAIEDYTLESSSLGRNGGDATLPRCTQELSEGDCFFLLSLFPFSPPSPSLYCLIRYASKELLQFEHR